MLGFRVWDTKLRGIFTFETVDVFNMSMYGSLRFWADGGLCKAPDRFIPMQSTGLKDAYGKIIYEKDILSWRLWPHYVVESVPAFMTHLLEMKKTILSKFYDDSIITDYIIVGNVFENAGMLEQLDLIEASWGPCK